MLGSLSGVLAGVSSWAFLEALDRVTSTRLSHPRLVYLLPVAGFVIAAAYHHGGARSSEGNALLLEQIHSPSEWVPRRMAPLVFAGTVGAHLFGASVGREGTALQMSGSLSDGVARLLRLTPQDRRLLLIAALGGGFGAVFGVPLAGAVFAMEVQTIGRIRYEALVPALSAALVGDLVVRSLGHHHVLRPQIVASTDAVLLAKVALAGLAFGLASVLFTESVHVVKRIAANVFSYPPWRTFMGGVATVMLAAVVGRDYLGLSLPLITRTMAGGQTGLWLPALKLLFTVVCLGCGFPGGEVTPLFVIGATLGAALAPLFGLPVVLLAGVGFVAVFAGAANTPLACTIMGAELFGTGALMPIAIACVVAYVFSSHGSIYATQRIDAAKGPDEISGLPTITEWRKQDRHRH